jgi:hypothetical protein
MPGTHELSTILTIVFFFYPSDTVMQAPLWQRVVWIRLLRYGNADEERQIPFLYSDTARTLLKAKKPPSPP